MPPPLRLPNADEQHLLEHLTVRLITEAERPRWNALVSWPITPAFASWLIGSSGPIWPPARWP
ncbi:MAG: hypothetical protein FJ403_19020 [Verrucomicrobia bacterium]|nr:hypothetical protein [Verrucomicrobiota bacterium]